MKTITVYVEGGGDTVTQQAELRSGFDALFRDLKNEASRKRISLRFVLRGSRQAAFLAFLNADATKPQSINVLLVDAEGPLTGPVGDAAARTQHLAVRDKWPLPSESAERVHLMVQCMETWIVTDGDALGRFYGVGFAAHRLPQRRNLEDENKQDVFDKLPAATRDSTKGEYHKGRHAKHLLTRINPDHVARRCPHFDILRTWLADTLQIL